MSEKNCGVSCRRTEGNLAIVVPSLARKAGGPSTAVASMAGVLVENGWRVSVIATDWGSDDGGLVPLSDGVKLHLFPIDRRWNPSPYRCGALTRWFRDAVREWDLIDIHALWSWIVVDVARAAAAWNVPFVITPHGQASRWDWEKHPWRKAWFERLYLRSTWQRAAAIRFVSEGEREDCIFPTQSRGCVVSNMVVPPGVPQESSANVLRACGIPLDALIILFLGRIDAQKGVLSLIDIFDRVWRKLPLAHLVLAGPEERVYARIVRQKTASLPSNRNIHLIGPVYGDAKWSIFGQSTLFVTLSRSEGRPIAALEALSMGLPVVLTPESQLSQVEAAGAGRTVPRDPDGAAGIVQRLLEDRHRLREMGRRARELATTHFSPAVIGSQLSAMYRKVLEEGAGRGISCSI